MPSPGFSSEEDGSPEQLASTPGRRLELRRRADGRAVLVHTATDPSQRIALLRTAGILGRARHPGVVEVLRLTDDAGTTEMELAWVGSHTLAGAPPSDPARAGALVAAVADTVADLHQVGVVHGSLRAEHVLVGEGGAPVLCGFGSASVAGADDSTRPSEDVSALGALLEDLLDGLPGEADPAEALPGLRPRRLPRSPGGRDRQAHLVRALRDIAAHAMAEPASARPSARSLSASLAEVVPADVLPLTPAPASTPAAGTAVGADADTGAVDGIDHLRVTMRLPAPRRGPRPVPLLAAVALTAAAMALATPVLGGVGREVQTPTVTSPPTPSTTPVVEVGGAVLAVGEPGDEAVGGSWWCTDTDYLAVLRPTTGHVWLLPADTRGSAAPSALFPGARSISVGTDRGCPVPVIETSDGDQIALPRGEGS